MTGTESDFGKEYDSLADVITFGVAPALLAYLWGLREFARDTWLLSVFFMVCCATRLARFNVQTKDGGQPLLRRPAHARGGGLHLLDPVLRPRVHETTSRSSCRRSWASPCCSSARSWSPPSATPAARSSISAGAGATAPCVPIAAIFLVIVYQPLGHSAGDRPPLHAVGARVRAGRAGCATAATPEDPPPLEGVLLTAIAILHPTSLLGKELRETIEAPPSGLVRSAPAEHPRGRDRHPDRDRRRRRPGQAATSRRSSRGWTSPSSAARRRPTGRSSPSCRRGPAASSSPPTRRGGRPAGGGRGQPRSGPWTRRRGFAPSRGGAARPSSPSAAGLRARGGGGYPHPAGLDEGASRDSRSCSRTARQIVSMAGRKPTPVFGTQLAFNLLPTPGSTDSIVAQLHAVLPAPPDRRVDRAPDPAGVSLPLPVGKPLRALRRGSRPPGFPQGPGREPRPGARRQTPPPGRRSTPPAATR